MGIISPKLLRYSQSHRLHAPPWAPAPETIIRSACSRTTACYASRPSGYRYLRGQPCWSTSGWALTLFNEWILNQNGPHIFQHETINSPRQGRVVPALTGVAITDGSGTVAVWHLAASADTERSAGSRYVQTFGICAVCLDD